MTNRILITLSKEQDQLPINLCQGLVKMNRNRFMDTNLNKNVEHNRVIMNLNNTVYHIGSKRKVIIDVYWLGRSKCKKKLELQLDSAGSSAIGYIPAPTIATNSQSMRILSPLSVIVSVGSMSLVLIHCLLISKRNVGLGGPLISNILPISDDIIIEE